MSVPVAVWNKIEALEQAYAELAAKVDQLTRRVGMALAVERRRIAVLESPAPAPDPVCDECGHGQRYHDLGEGGCSYYSVLNLRCPCQSFVPTAEPEPAPLDPVKCVTCKGTGMFVLWRYEDNVFGIVCPSCKGGAR